jgi:hypothetical protein
MLSGKIKGIRMEERDRILIAELENSVEKVVDYIPYNLWKWRDHAQYISHAVHNGEYVVWSKNALFTEEVERFGELCRIQKWMTGSRIKSWNVEGDYYLLHDTFYHPGGCYFPVNIDFVKGFNTVKVQYEYDDQPLFNDPHLDSHWDPGPTKETKDLGFEMKLLCYGIEMDSRGNVDYEKQVDYTEHPK